MAHLTLSIADDLYEEMKRHPEVKWSQVARRAIMEHLQRLRDRSPSRDVVELLSEETRAKLRSIKEEDAKRFYRGMVKAEWKRVKSLTQTS